MNLFGLMETSGSAMQAERMRAEVVAANMANAETTRTESGGPYRETKDVIHQATTSAPVAEGRSAGAQGEEADGTAAPLFPADQFATSAGGANRIAYQDPEIGWVTVRAHAEPNGVHASLVAGSMDAAQSLSGHLSGLSAYLADHHTSVQHVSISTPEIHRGEQLPGQSMDRGTAQGGSQERQTGTGAEAEPTAGLASHPRAFVQRSEEVEPQVTAARGSRYISVVA